MYKDYISFKIMKDRVSLISSETAYGLNTVVEINGKYHYLGCELPTISLAINVWQKINNQILNAKELHTVMVANKLISKTK